MASAQTIQVVSPGAPSRLKRYAAFAIIYLVWGSTFLAIRICVHVMPPFLFGAGRFLTSGTLLYGWMRWRGVAAPTRRQWASAFVMGVLIFVLDYGLIFWAEQWVPSGVAAVMMAMIPGFMALSEIAILRTRRMTWQLALALGIGLSGVAVLMIEWPAGGKAAAPEISLLGAGILLFAALSWSVSSSVSRKLDLPKSQAMNAAAQMLAGGVLLALVGVPLGQIHAVDVHAWSGAVWFSLAYLILVGSLVAFQAYVWLIHHESPTRVGTYAYVNPVVAVLLGYFVGGEPLGARTLLGSLFVLSSVVIITRLPAQRMAPARQFPEPG